MNQFKANQKLFFKTRTVCNLKLLGKHKVLFSFSDTSALEGLYSITGRPPVDFC